MSSRVPSSRSSGISSSSQHCSGSIALSASASTRWAASVSSVITADQKREEIRSRNGRSATGTERTTAIASEIESPSWISRATRRTASSSSREYER